MPRLAVMVQPCQCHGRAVKSRAVGWGSSCFAKAAEQAGRSSATRRLGAVVPSRLRRARRCSSRSLNVQRLSRARTHVADSALEQAVQPLALRGGGPGDTQHDGPSLARAARGSRPAARHARRAVRSSAVGRARARSARYRRDQVQVFERQALASACMPLSHLARGAGIRAQDAVGGTGHQAPRPWLGAAAGSPRRSAWRASSAARGGPAAGPGRAGGAPPAAMGVLLKMPPGFRRGAAGDFQGQVAPASRTAWPRLEVHFSRPRATSTGADLGGLLRARAGESLALSSFAVAPTVQFVKAVAAGRAAASEPGWRFMREPSAIGAAFRGYLIRHRKDRANQPRSPQESSPALHADARDAQRAVAVARPSWRRPAASNCLRVVGRVAIQLTRPDPAHGRPMDVFAWRAADPRGLAPRDARFGVLQRRSIGHVPGHGEKPIAIALLKNRRVPGASRPVLRAPGAGGLHGRSGSAARGRSIGVLRVFAERQKNYPPRKLGCCCCLAPRVLGGGGASSACLAVALGVRGGGETPGVVIVLKARRARVAALAARARGLQAQPLKRSMAGRSARQAAVLPCRGVGASSLGNAGLAIAKDQGVPLAAVWEEKAHAFFFRQP
ncbi:hypothetical protein FQR65_LT20550 [Abscondita terminalis]|nr:hypothetical protein FQR65_LT20550 [Abscondita terminalis]